MKIFLGKTAAPLAFILTAVLTAGSSFALTPLLNTNLLKDKIPDLKVSTWLDKCNKLKSQVDDKLTKLEGNKNIHFKTYIELIAKLEEKLTKWEGLGLETGELAGDLKVLQGKVEKFETDYKEYKESLETIKALDCDNTTTEYANALKDAKNALKKVREDVVDIKNYYLTEIRPDILDLKKQIISN